MMADFTIVPIVRDGRITDFNVLPSGAPRESGQLRLPHLHRSDAWPPVAVGKAKPAISNVTHIGEITR